MRTPRELPIRTMRVFIIGLDYSRYIVIPYGMESKSAA
jgi:hypothetical protein